MFTVYNVNCYLLYLPFGISLTVTYCRSYETKPKIATTANAFNVAYSYLMLLLQNAWRTSNQQKDEEKKQLVIGGMPALMHGVLKPIATFLAGMYS